MTSACSCLLTEATIAELESRLQLQDEELRRQDDRQQELSHDLHEVLILRQAPDAITLKTMS